MFGHYIHLDIKHLTYGTKNKVLRANTLTVFKQKVNYLPVFNFSKI